MLARTFEAAGMSTILVTNMPIWAEKIGVPRTLGVELPFVHILGLPRNVEQQMRIIRQALDVLETAQTPGSMVHSSETWPGSFEEGLRVSNPETPAPIAAEMSKHMLSFLKGMRRDHPASDKD